MKSFLVLAIFLVVALLLQAQDTTLPQGRAYIYLREGKKIKDVKLWMIDTLKIEFVQAGNLAEVKISDVNRIESHDQVITFDSTNHMINKWFDMIFLNNGDTLYGNIQEVSDWGIKYVLSESSKKNLMNVPYKGYAKRNLDIAPSNNKNQQK